MAKLKTTQSNDTKLTRDQFKAAYPNATITQWVRYWATRRLPQ